MINTIETTNHIKGNNKGRINRIDIKTNEKIFEQQNLYLYFP